MKKILEGKIHLGRIEVKDQRCGNPKRPPTEERRHPFTRPPHTLHTMNHPDVVTIEEERSDVMGLLESAWYGPGLVTFSLFLSAGV